MRYNKRKADAAAYRTSARKRSVESMKAEVNGLNERLVAALRGRGMTVSAAESCTGGLLSALITDVPGSSEVIGESIVTYSNEAKMRELGVSEETLERFGAVSRETAKEMAEGIRRRTGADIGAGITGIAGPGGGTPEKPVGTVYAAISDGERTKVIHMLHDGSRAEVREKTCLRVLAELLELLG